MANKEKGSDVPSETIRSCEGPLYVRQLSEIEQIYDDEYYRFRRLTQPFEIQLQCVRKFLSITSLNFVIIIVMMMRV